MSNYFAGFSLLELLIVITLIGILTSISIPLYSDHLITENRLEAANELEKLAIAMEQYQIANNNYDEVSLTKLKFPSLIAHKQYELHIQLKAEGYLLAAKPIGKQAKKDKCKTLSLNEKGVKRVSGTLSMEECW